LAKYNRINNVMYTDGFECEIIMEEDSPDYGYGNGLDIELDSYCFNCDFEVSELIRSTPIYTVKDIYEYCKRNDIKLDKSRVTEEGFVAGYFRDYIVKDDLTSYWLNE